MANPSQTVSGVPVASRTGESDALAVLSVDESGLLASRGFAIMAIVVGAVLRIASYYFSDNAGGDALARVAATAKWLSNPHFRMVFAGAYEPGHFWLIALFSLICPDVNAAGRLLSLVLGIACLVVVWRLGVVLYGASAGALSAVVFSFSSLQIGYSATSSSEVSQLAFLLLSLLPFFSKARTLTTRMSNLALSGLFLSVAESIRFESWIFFGGMALILVVTLLTDHDRAMWTTWAAIAPVFAFGMTAGIWPVFMMVYSAMHFHDPMYLVTLNHGRTLAALAEHPLSMGYQLALMPGVVFITLSPLGFLGAAYGLLRSFSSQCRAYFAGLTLLLGGVQLYEVLMHGLLASARYSITLAAMLAVISGLGIQKICERLTPNHTTLLHWVTFCLLLVNLVAIYALSEFPNRTADKIASLSPRLRFSRHIASVASCLRSRLQPQDAVIVDNYNAESNVIASAAGLPLVPGRRAYLANAINEISAQEYLNRVRPKFMVFADKGVLRKDFDIPQGCSSVVLGNVKFSCKCTNQIYRLFELGYQ